MRKGYCEPRLFNVFDNDGMLVHRGDRCVFPVAKATQVAAESAGTMEPESGAAAEVDAAIRLAAERASAEDRKRSLTAGSRARSLRAAAGGARARPCVPVLEVCGDRRSIAGAA